MTQPVGTSAKVRSQCRRQTPLLRPSTLAEGISDDPVSDNDGSVISCGNKNWCCQPGVAAGTCNCASGDGTFFLQDGTAQTIIGIEGLENTSTDVVPISLASVPAKTASYPAITHTPNQTDATQDKPTTSIGPGYITSSSASGPSPIASSSSPSSSSQSILTTTLQPTIITMLPPSGVPTSSSPPASPTSSGGITRRNAIIAEVVLSLVIVAAVAVGIFCCWRIHRRRARRGDFIQHKPSSPAGAGQSDPMLTDHNNQDIEYRTRFPLQRNPPESLVNRSAYELHQLVVPDHDTDRPAQPNLYRPPALDPYAAPRVPDIGREPSRLQRRPVATPSSDYRSTMRGANRPRGDGFRTTPRVPQARMPEVPEMNLDWSTGGPR